MNYIVRRRKSTSEPNCIQFDAVRAWKHCVLIRKLTAANFQCTKTGFQRCAMQITIATKGALSSVRAHSFRFQCTKTGFQRCAMQITITIKGALSSVRAHLFI
ncbi:hypothetical protein T12_15199 [Trichinella patagoniensis]|uniref:Uncharacterized protein n=1 Tax=Trichinella patagoniensis TaxID=990121 RepID=A0A0V1AG41_9BILA|nr:hypothetical protein T12_15199 [Trichinella patagoniensis]